MTVSVQAIAREVGVSRSAVSHVLNGRDHKISAPVRARILRAVSRHDYRPNRLVRALQTQRTQVIGVIVPGSRSSFYADLVASIQVAARAHQFQCFLCQSHSSMDVLEEEVRVLREYRVDGLIISPANSFERPQFYRQLRQRRIPLVVVDVPVNGVSLPFVSVDDVEAGRLATEYLLRLGRRRIVCLRGVANALNMQQRVAGYESALKAAGVAREAMLVTSATSTPEEAGQTVRDLLRRGVRFTGLVAPTDGAAVAAVRALEEQGRRVPDDVAVVGCGNLDIATMVRPALTTVDQHAAEIGRQAFQLLLEQIEGRSSAPRQRLLAPTLVIRESTASPRLKQF